MELVADTVILYCFKESHSINEVALCFQIVFSLKEILLNLKKTFSNIKKNNTETLGFKHIYLGSLNMISFISENVKSLYS